MSQKKLNDIFVWFPTKIHDKYTDQTSGIIKIRQKLHTKPKRSVENV